MSEKAPPPRVLVVHTPGVDPNRRGVVYPSPGSLVVLGRWCHAWGLAMGARVSSATARDRAQLAAICEGARADGVVIGVGSERDDAELAAAVEDLRVPAVAVVVGGGARPPILAAVKRRSTLVHGRGIDGYRWALQHVVARLAWPVRPWRYGVEPEQHGDLRVPAGEGAYPVAVLLHGGFWQAPWTADLMEGLAVDLVRRGWLTWNVEYRRLGAGGGWPQTGADAVTALDHVARFEDLGADLSRVTLIGHSAGAQLAIHAASRCEQVAPGLVVALAPITDLAIAREQRLGLGAGFSLLNAVPDTAEAIAAASPIARLPLGVPQLLVHGTRDELVPVDHSRHYYDAGRATGDAIEFVELPDADHFALIDPADGAWRLVLEQLGRHKMAPRQRWTVDD